MRDIYNERRRLQEEMDRMIVNAFGHRPAIAIKPKGRCCPTKKDPKFRTPLTNMYETEKKVIACIELPGVEKKDIQLDINEGAIEVKVETKVEKKKDKEGEYYYASSSQSFYRRMPIPKYVDSEKAEAEYKNGMLKIEIPKKSIKDNKPKRLNIK